uniref:Uncharacterized protein n=1 Tax=Eptatretus burgeri TaxID=7764 RepID=A0A8C4QQT1_EPTBU
MMSHLGSNPDPAINCHPGRQKYFDSADYFMAQYKLKKEQSQGLVSEATGDHVLTPQNLPHAKSSTGENKCAQ